MQRHLQRLLPGWVGVAGVVGAFLSVSTLSGCPGTLDPKLAAMASGSGGSGSGSGGSGSGGNSSGGSTGSGGSNNSGGATGSGGSSADCTGNNDINYIVMGTGVSDCAKSPVGPGCNACAQSGCHIPDSGNTKSASVSGGLDMTLDANIGSRLIGVFAGTVANASECTSAGKNYLDAHSNPASGLLIDKVKANPSCGKRMPYPGITTLTSTQITCFEAWAESLIMAAP
jgi:hypothetical protein